MLWDRPMTLCEVTGRWRAFLEVEGLMAGIASSSSVDSVIGICFEMLQYDNLVEDDEIHAANGRQQLNEYPRVERHCRPLR
jgi:hypothetical protein